MSRTHPDFDALLDATTAEIAASTPDDATVAAATSRVWDVIAREAAQQHGQQGPGGSVDTLRGCADMQALIPAFVAGELPAAKATLVADHTRECLACRRALLAERGQATVASVQSTWSAAPAASAARPWRRYLLAAAVAIVAIGSAVVLSRNFGPAPNAVAEVLSLDGGLFLVGDNGGTPLRAGAELAAGQTVRTGQGGSAVVRLADGSQVELRERSELAVRTGGEDTTLDLSQGSVIVQAAKRSRGHLFVDTADCRVAVTGTIFAVNHGTKGSRVSVIEGQVRVEQGRREDLLRPGDQVTTRATLTKVPVAAEISWSRDADRYRQLLAELDALGEALEQGVTLPAPRTSTRLLDLMPSGVVIYGSVPNISESVAQAHDVFEARLAQSPVLADLLARRGAGEFEQELDELVARLQRWGGALGSELAVGMTRDARDAAGQPSAGLALAEVRDAAGLRALIAQEVAGSPAAGHVVVVEDPAGLPATGDERSLYVWITADLAVASNQPELVRTTAAALGTGQGGFAGSELHGQLAAAYTQGVEWLLAADLASFSAEVTRHQEGSRLANQLGFDQARHLVATWSDAGDHPQGSATLTFAGPRQGVASWLAEPAPMGSLAFLSPDTLAFAAFLSREPVEIADELVQQLLARDPNALQELAETQQQTGVDLRNDLAATLGGEIAVALDGPLVPRPAVKLVVEVYDPAQLQATLTTLLARLDHELRQHGKSAPRLVSEEHAGRTVHRLVMESGVEIAAYTFTDSYLVAASTVALLDAALATRASGADITTAAKFRALLPADGFSDFSALAYEDVGDRLAPLAGAISGSAAQLTAEQRQTIESTAKLTPSALGYAYAGSDRITFAASLGSKGPFSLASLLGTGGLSHPAALLGGFLGDLPEPSAAESSAEASAR